MNKKKSLITLAIICVVALGGYFLRVPLSKDVKEGKEEIELVLSGAKNGQKAAESKSTLYHGGNPQLIKLEKKPKATATTEQTSSSTTTQSTTKIRSFTKETIYMEATAVRYEEGGEANGQAIIDGNPNGVASTWGGITPFSGTDGMNTHFIGHHWGAFDPVITLDVGDKVIVTDENNNDFSYIVQRIAIVTTDAVDVQTGQNLFSEITSIGGGERIVLQTCTSETQRKICFCVPL